MCGLSVALALTTAGTGARAAGGRDAFAERDLREWLTYLSSDRLAGRAVFTEGLGLAAGYIQERLRSWGLTPAGDAGGFTQAVQVRGVKVVRRSSVTVRVGGASRTFRDGDGIAFPRNAGGNQTLSIDRVEFSGYGLHAPAAKHLDFRDRSVEGAAVVYLGVRGPRAIDRDRYRRVLDGRSRYAVDALGALATIGPPPEDTRGGPGPERNPNAPDFTTTRHLDLPVPPAVSGSDDFFEFLFSQAPVRYSELKRRAADQDDLPTFRLENVSMTFNVSVDYTVVRTRVTQNIVAIVEGSDPRLKSTYVALGAHYDHVGYAESAAAPPGRVTPGTADDRIWNGADDDGSGTVALMALARAYAQGPRPRRSMLFVWHAGEESGLYGSRYFTDYPTVPLEAIVAQLNVDMIGRNRGDLASQSNTVYLVGSDRISTELHQLSRDANQLLKPPLALDYELNDADDLELIYYRSDHFSYAAKGIPVIFFTTGLHPDYHANTDEVSKIEFSKMARIAELVYQTGRLLGNLDHAPVRDRKGARAGRGTR
jgi:hypothetical protein